MPHPKIASLKKEIVTISHLFYARGWSLATSSNYSARLDRDRILITSSGKDKGALRPQDILLLNLHGKPAGRGTGSKPSAEAVLHCRIFEIKPEIGAILHTHSKYATLLSLQNAQQIVLQGYEMLKALCEVETHDHSERIPIFKNSQNMNSLADTIEKWFRVTPHSHAFLLKGHGLYTWGRDIAEAKRHVEALEFLFECESLRRSAERRL